MISHGLFYFSYCFLLPLLLSVSPKCRRKTGTEGAHKCLLGVNKVSWRDTPQQCPSGCYYCSSFRGSCWSTPKAVSSCCPQFSGCRGDVSHRGAEEAPLPSSVPPCVIQDISASLSRSPHLMESLLQTPPTASACSSSFTGLRQELRIMSEINTVMSSLDLCPEFASKLSPQNWNLVLREKSNYTVGSPQPICLEGLKSRQNHLNALVASFAWEMPEKVGERLYYFIHLGYHLATVVVKSCIGAVLSSQQCFF